LQLLLISIFFGMLFKESFYEIRKKFQFCS
jgi:hypothetical protein